MRNLHIRLLPLFVIAALSAAALPSCGGETNEPTVSPRLVVYDRTVASLTGMNNTKLEPVLIKGTYGRACKINAGGTWDLVLNDPNDRSLEVVLNDTFANCPLTLTHIGVRVNDAMPPVDFPLSPPILLGMGYANDPVAVNQPNPPGLAFYTNARVNSLAGPTYTNDFAIHIVYSDQKLACDEEVVAIYAKVNAMATGNPVPPPNYAMDFTNLKLYVDANLVVQPTSLGDVVMKLPGTGAVPGEEWKGFDEGTRCCTTYSFAEIDTIYKNFTPITGGTINASDDIAIPWRNFDLLGQTLPRWRTVIVKHTDGGGVYSYELFQILFRGPMN